MEILWHEEKFEYPLMKLIEERAKEKDISILAAAKVVIPEYAAPLRWRDEDFDEEMRLKDLDERAAIKAEYEKTHTKKANFAASFFDIGGQNANQPKK